MMEEFIVSKNSISSRKDSAEEKTKKRAEDLRAGPESKKQKNAKEKPLPLQRQTAPPKSFPFATLGRILGPAAKRIHEIVKAPDSICGQSILAAAALITQAHADIHIDGRIHPLSLFMLTVAESGDRKSAVDNIVLKEVHKYQEMLKKISDEQKRIYKNKMDVLNKLRRNAMNTGDAKSMEKKLNMLPSEPRFPLEPYFVVEEPTYEGLVKLYDVGQPNLGLFSDEGGRMLGGHGMSKDNLLKTACGLSNLWDGKPITRIRGGDKNLLLYGRRFSMHLMAQEIVLSEVLKNALLVGQGMLARCLTVYPPTNAGNRPYNEIDLSMDPAIQDFWELTIEILDQPFPLTSPEILNELNPRPLPLNPSAKRKWILFHDELDRALGPNGQYRPIRRMANKAAEQALRVAGVLTLIENFDAGSISEDVIDRAIELIRFYLDEALRIADASFSDPNLELAQAVLDWMRKKTAAEGNQKLFSIKEIYQTAGPRDVRNKRAALAVMNILKDHHIIEQPDPNKLEWKVSNEEG